MGYAKSLVSLALLPLLAQAAPSTNDTDEHIVVLGRQAQSVDQIAAAVSVIDQSDIERSGATNLEDLLRGRAGIQVSNSGSGPVLSLRGFAPGQAGSNVLVLVDGRRLNSQSLAAPALGGVQLANIERIEILNGSAGVLYGDQAVGGVINIITKHGVDGGQVSATLGTDHHQALGASASKGFANGLYVDTNLAWDKNDNYRDHAQSRTQSAEGRVGYKTDRRHLFAELSFNQDDRDQPGPLAFSQQDRKASRPEFANDFINEITRVGRLGWEEKLDDNWQLLVDGSSSHRKRDYNQSFMDWAVDSPYQANERLNRVSPRIKGSFEHWQWLGGIDYEHGKYDDNNTSLRVHNKRDSKSAYGTGQWQQGALTLGAGLRYTKVEDNLVYAGTYDNGVNIDNHATTWSLSGQYQLSQGRVFARVDRNVRFAKLDEQGYTPAGVVGLKPQTGYSYELGWAQPGLSLSAFRLDLKDEIVFDNNAPAPAGGLFAGANVNADKSRRYGVNIHGDHSFDALTLGFDYQWLDAKYTQGSSDGHQVPWVSKHAGGVYGDYQWTATVSTRLEYQYRGPQYLLSDNLNQAGKLGGYGLWALSGQWQQGPWQVVLRADNLFDKHYADNAQYNAYGENAWYPGNGREVNLTGRYSF